MGAEPLSYEVLSLRVTGRAARWISLLQDFGHLDGDSADRLLLAAADLHAEMAMAGDRIDLPLVRRAAAMMLFGTGATDLGPVLEEDWPLLFS